MCFIYAFLCLGAVCLRVMVLEGIILCFKVTQHNHKSTVECDDKSFGL